MSLTDKLQKEQTENNQNNPGNKNSDANNSIPNNNTNNNVGRQTTPQRNAAKELAQPITRLPGTEDRKDRNRSHKETIKLIQMNMLKLQPKI